MVNVDEEGKKEEEEEEEEQECIPEMARDAESLRALKKQLEHVHQQKLMKQEESPDSSKYVDSSDSDWKPASGDYGSDELYIEDESTDEGEDEGTNEGEDEGTDEGEDEHESETEVQGEAEGEDDGDSEIEEIEHPTKKEPKQEQSMKVKAQVKERKARQVRRLRVAVFGLLHKQVERKGRHLR